MEHWFDDLAKKLADGDRSRRTFLGGLTALLGGTVAAAWIPAPAAVLQRAGRRRMPAGVANAAPGPTQANGRLASMQPSNDVSLTSGPCTFTRKGKRVVRTLTSTTSANGFEITLHETRSTGPIQSEHDVSIDVNGKSQYSVVRRKAGAGRTLTAPAIVITAGEAFGVQNMRLRSQDGRTLQGMINGRAIAPIDIERAGALNQIQFADGQPAPKIAENPTLRDAIRRAFQKASEDAKLCFSSEPMPEGHRRNEVSGEPGAVYESGANAGFSKGCQACFNNCYSQFNSCQWNAAADCVAAGFFWGVCMGFKMNDCGNNQDSCEQKCAYGSTCCPVKCDNAPPSNGPGLCCSAGYKCVDATNGYCCPDGYSTACVSGFCVCCPDAQAVCNGICCPRGQACSQEEARVEPWANGAGICCPQGALNTRPVSCGGKCCAPGEKCVSGPLQAPICCPEKLACGGTCCDGGECRNGKCYGPPSKPAPCLSGLLINGKCCPSDRACANVCCPDGQVCVDQQNGICKKLQCPSNQTVCLSRMPNGASTAICCSGRNPTCCNTQCCKAGEICCQNKRGVLGCYPQSKCAGQIIK